ncbi:alpha-ketoglutarate-dependent dioxygenase AlkB [Dasania sp. GY-MA-18]|uniref:Alpha-ketoglutarate-dependent dioxygenase AlkB n=1 Tax=Dasania phycosphaerae TaxID=2950436 RepID=A0A9J6RK01_9GAMM|nr:MULTISPECIES: alpha-ketoglutarate-dependent dioxygenase AlkB [Dasania]MCR8921889.1 alpha-ketoglutarate-dependent dioxygenase AlkB [Dasania sp. GY-MA-18]MCZ0864317.1 alpha-ketoglutarate-dependent dioxygenase AlkB [Dasania phycosphaerae]MCZ0868045.1 alpha-ketoglutarate-dependent dioxygenase AlkB [Dasania phycosphaerae]
MASQQDFLFAAEESYPLAMDNADVRYYPQFIADSKAWLPALQQQIQWRQDSIKVYGKQQPIPRLNAWYGDEGIHYAYSGLQLQHHNWCPVLAELRAMLEQKLGLRFNSVLANYYRNGQDSVGWHSDNEKELGPEPIIASLSFGDTRRFSFRSNSQPRSTSHIDLASGSLLLMQGGTQQHWQHQLAKTQQVSVQGRINLTFRRIVASR